MRDHLRIGSAAPEVTAAANELDGTASFVGINLRNASGVVGSGAAPSALRRSIISGVRMATTTAPCSLSM